MSVVLVRWADGSLSLTGWGAVLLAVLLWVVLLVAQLRAGGGS